MAAAAKERGLPLPATFAQAPTVPENLVFHWQAFTDLHTTRMVAAEECPISWLAIQGYARHYDLVDESEFDYFKCIIMATDRGYLDLTKKIREANK